jgi:hypothetical protein
MTIPRRELLSGAALVLVGSASGCGGGTPQANRAPNAAAPTVATGPGSAAAPARLRTAFTDAFTAHFIGDPTKILEPAPPPQLDPWPDPNRLWPAVNQTTPSILSEYLTFLNVLMTVGYVPAPAPNAPSGSLGDRIAQFLQQQNWPTQTPTFVPGTPPEYKNDELTTVHLVEISVIQDRLLQAINSYKPTPDSKGGGGSNWPPH